ncbi:MAG: hypothetical protein NZO16_03415 [Deltaproteobacteria bacterium]|nr:hypothetical protein [Deltaproteobacteria bacterium]
MFQPSRNGTGPSFETPLLNAINKVVERLNRVSQGEWLFGVNLADETIDLIVLRNLGGYSSRIVFSLRVLDAILLFQNLGVEFFYFYIRCCFLTLLHQIALKYSNEEFARFVERNISVEAEQNYRRADAENREQFICSVANHLELTVEKPFFRDCEAGRSFTELIMCVSPNTRVHLDNSQLFCLLMTILSDLLPAEVIEPVKSAFEQNIGQLASNSANIEIPEFLSTTLDRLYLVEAKLLLNDFYRILSQQFTGLTGNDHLKSLCRAIRWIIRLVGFSSDCTTLYEESDVYSCLTFHCFCFALYRVVAERLAAETQKSEEVQSARDYDTRFCSLTSFYKKFSELLEVVVKGQSTHNS